MTQTAQLHAWLKIKPITPIEALRELGIYRLSARVRELREMGIPVETIRKAVKTRHGKAMVAQYQLRKQK